MSCAWRCQKGASDLEAGAPDSWEPPNLGAGNWIQVVRKSSEHFFNHWPISQASYYWLVLIIIKESSLNSVVKIFLSLGLSCSWPVAAHPNDRHSRAIWERSKADESAHGTLSLHGPNSKLQLMTRLSLFLRSLSREWQDWRDTINSL